jgi:long-chain fatty acid transport protein
MKSRHITLIAAAAGLTGTALGNGFYIPVQAPEATGRGNAWLATADTASAVYYNAAGLTQLGSPDLVVGAYSVRLGIEAETAAGDFDNDASWSLIPQIYGAVPVDDRLVAGFGLNTPFGLSTDWGAATPFSPIANETELKYLTGWAVAGYKITDEWSIGGGFGLSYADARFIKTAAAPGDFSRFEGDDEGLCWTLSTRWQPHEQHSFGAVYRSETNFNLDGDADALGGAPGESAELGLITPATAAIGYAYTPCKEWSIEANIEWVNWEQLDTETLSKSSGNVPIAFNWDSNFIYSVGATRFLDGGWSVSAGYNYIENSIPDDTFTPGVSDADRHWLNFGVGRQWEEFGFNFAYQYAFSDRDVSGSPFGLADGTFKSRFHGLMMNCDWRF